MRLPGLTACIALDCTITGSRSPLSQTTDRLRHATGDAASDLILGFPLPTSVSLLRSEMCRARKEMHVSNDFDPHWPWAHAEPPDVVSSDGPPAQPQDPTGVRPSAGTAEPGSPADVDSSPQPTEPPPEYSVAASGPPLPPVIEAFPGSHDAQQPLTPARGTEYRPAAAGPKRGGRRRILIGTTAGVVVLLFTVVAVIAVVGYLTKKNNTTAAKPPPAAVLEGTYRLDIDWAKQTENGATAPSSDTTNASTWWALRSSCSATGCVASAIQLDNTNHQMAAAPPLTAELHFVNGGWQRTPVRHQYPRKRCLGADAKFGPGTETQLISWSVAPQPDKSLRGVWTNTVLTDECGFIGTVWQAPLVAVHTGDVPPTVTVADPSTIAAIPRTSSPVPVVAGVTPVLDGTFRVEYLWAKQTVNGKPAIGDDMTPGVDWWAFRSLCTSAGCVATGAQLAEESPHGPVGGGMVLRFAEGHWQQTPHIGPGQGCPGGTNPKTATTEIYEWSLEPRPDGTLRGSQSDTAISAGCDNQGFVYRTPLSVTRTGDVSAAVVLADPALFAPPPAPPSTSPHP